MKRKSFLKTSIVAPILALLGIRAARASKSEEVTWGNPDWPDTGKELGYYDLKYESPVISKAEVIENPDHYESIPNPDYHHGESYEAGRKAGWDAGEMERNILAEELAVVERDLEKSRAETASVLESHDTLYKDCANKQLTV